MHLVIMDLLFNIFHGIFLQKDPVPQSAAQTQPAALKDLREKREELNRQILKEEEDKAKIQKEPWHPT